MPIRPENRDRYPADWPQISLAIRTVRAAGRCECAGECGRGSHTGRCPNVNGRPAYGTGSRVVLTTAHLNHQPEDCRPANLRAMCQGCHLHYDRDHHRQTAAATRRAAIEAAGQLTLGTTRSETTVMPDTTPTPRPPRVPAALACRLVIHRPGFPDQHAVEFPTGQLLAVDAEQGLIAYTSAGGAIEDVPGAWYEYRREDQIPAWEAVYSPGTASNYLIGYCNDRSAAQAAAEAWMREQRYDRPGRLDWVHDPTRANEEFDAWYRLTEDRPDGNATIAGLIVRHRKPAAAHAPAIAEPKGGPR